jgi:uncharacterized protein YwgA
MDFKLQASGPYSETLPSRVLHIITDSTFMSIGPGNWEITHAPTGRSTGVIHNPYVAAIISIYPDSEF